LFLTLEPLEAVPRELMALEQRQLQMRPVYEALSQVQDLFPELQPTRLEGVVTADSRLELIEAKRQDSAGALPIANQRPAEHAAEIGQVRAALTSDQCLAKANYCEDASADWIVVRQNITADTVFGEADQSRVWGVGCCLAGQISYAFLYSRGPGDVETWFDYDLTAGQFVDHWSFDNNFRGFMFVVNMYNFTFGSLATQCAGGRND
jgi:hypothetical protein